mgnify:CR=1 FL=1
MYNYKGIKILLDLEKNTSIYEIYYLIAVGYYKLKNFLNCKTYIDKAAEFKADDWKLELLLAKFYKKTEKFKNALEILKNIKDFKNIPEVIYLISEIYQSREMKQKADEYMEVV